MGGGCGYVRWWVWLCEVECGYVGWWVWLREVENLNGVWNVGADVGSYGMH